MAVHAVITSNALHKLTVRVWLQVFDALKPRKPVLPMQIVRYTLFWHFLALVVGSNTQQAPFCARIELPVALL
jgi:hypothetical protein